MKKLVLTAALFTGLLFAGNLKAQQAPADPNAPVIKFETDTIKYGTIAYASDGYRFFNFTNTGKEPLIIKETHGSCGCTIPTAPKEPIQPGQSGQIKVHYDTQRPGHFIKSVTVTSNANPSTKVVYIVGDVMPNPNAGTPNNGAPAKPQTPAPAAH
ncbi:MAG: DUF1573 domain-containing protein [Bacteroidia bacterium]|jgi:hypothetical protein